MLKSALFLTYVRPTLRRTFLQSLTAIALAACTVAHGQAGQDAQKTRLQIQVPSVVQQSLDLGHADPAKKLYVTICMPPASQEGLQAFADQVSDPKSPLYRHFLTPKQVGDRFGQSDASVARIVDYLKGQGFRITLVADNKLNVMTECTVAQAESAFSTTIDNYHALDPNAPGRLDYYSFSTVPSLPSRIAGAVIGISGIENFTKPQPRVLTPTQTRVLYDTIPMYSSGFQGQNRNTAISNFDGFRLTNVPLYYSQYGLPAPSGGVGSNINVVAISGGAGSGTAGGEGDLDIQMVLGMAPLSSFTIYDGGNGDLIGVLTREANDNLADVISESWGWRLDPSTATSAHNLRLSMTAQGITYMVATGDNGTSLEPFSYPDYDGEVLLVGGTVASTDAIGNRLSEDGWGGSGGGWSTNSASFNVHPTWQVGKGVPTGINYRMGPDVALNAATATGAYYFFQGGTLVTGDGTSFACPVFTGCLAVVEQKLISLGQLPPFGGGKMRFGRIANLIYGQNGRPDVWHDITTGNNGTLPNGNPSNAGPGWDTVTGWGAIDFNAFVNSVKVTSTVAYPATAVILTEGQYATGNLISLFNIDGNTYNTLSGQLGHFGQYAGSEVDFTVDRAASQMTSLGISWTSNSPVGSTMQIFAYNWVNQTYEVVRAAPGTGGMKTYAANFRNFANYVNPSTLGVRTIVRAFIPSRLNPGSFLYIVDQAQLQATVAGH